MNEPVLSKSNLKNYMVISEPGTHLVKVSNSVLPNYLIEEGSKSRYIVNLRVATIDNLEHCLSIMGDREVVPFKLIRHCLMAGVIWENSLKNIEDLPVKGESVVANFDMVDEKLCCTSITLLPRKSLEYFNLNSYCSSRKLLKQLFSNEKKIDTNTK